MSVNLNTNLPQNWHVGDVWPSYQEWYHPIVKEYYVNYPVWTYIKDQSKTEQAFKIAQKLQEKKLINLKTVKDFIDFVNELIEIL